MTELTQLRDRCKRMIVGLAFSHAIVTILILVTFQFVVVSLLPKTEQGGSAANNLTVFGIMFVIVMIPNALLVLFGFARLRRQSCCPTCGTFLNHLLFRPEGQCHKCGGQWTLQDGEPKWSPSA